MLICLSICKSASLLLCSRNFFCKLSFYYKYHIIAYNKKIYIFLLVFKDFTIEIQIFVCLLIYLLSYLLLIEL